MKPKVVTISTFILLTLLLTSCDFSPPTISEILVSGVSSDSANITWATDELSTSQVEYGKTDQYGASTTLDKTLTNSHHITLTELDWETIYYFRVTSEDDAGNQAISGNYTFTTGQKVWTDGHISLIMDRVLRTETWPDDINLGYGYSDPTPDGGHDFFCIYLTITHIEDVVLDSTFPLVSWTLLDAEGNEYSKPIVRGIRYELG